MTEACACADGVPVGVFAPGGGWCCPASFITPPRPPTSARSSASAP